jgi:hypothetical protein
MEGIIGIIIIQIIAGAIGGNAAGAAAKNTAWGQRATQSAVPWAA